MAEYDRVRAPGCTGSAAVTADPDGAVSRSKLQVSVASVQQLLARIVALPVSPGRWLSDLMDEADEIWELVDDDDTGCISLPG